MQHQQQQQQTTSLSLVHASLPTPPPYYTLLLLLPSLIPPLFIINPTPPFLHHCLLSSSSSSMENHGLFKSGAAMRLPPGFRFHPTDEELVLQYLRRKVLSFPLPASIIPDLHFFYSNPWDIPGESGEERYFFSKKGGRSNRATYEGYWKSTGVDRHVVSSGGKLVGFKKTLVFYRGKSLPGCRTAWTMHEYRLASDMVEAGAEDWVLCRVFLKKKKKKNRKKRGEEEAVRWQSRGGNSNGTIVAGVAAYDFLKNDKCFFLSSCSSSCSSVITELNLKGLDDDDDPEESSCCSTSIFCNGSRPSPSSSSSGFRREP